MVVLALGEASLAAAPVVESEAQPPSEAPDQTAASDDQQGFNTIYYQLQLLQDDVRRLQGIVEEQNHRIERLAQEQRDRYIELDQRLLERQAPPEATADAGTDPPGASQLGVRDIVERHMGDVAGTDPPGASQLGTGPPGTEVDAYNAAFAVVKDAGTLVPSERVLAYQQALGLFDALILNYPAGQFTPNAYYWKGEIHLYTDDLELARQAFVQVVHLFGDHPKAPDALYKLGVVYHRLGENQRALEYLDRVIAEHPEHTAAGLAQLYAAELR